MSITMLRNESPQERAVQELEFLRDSRRELSKRQNALHYEQPKPRKKLAERLSKKAAHYFKATTAQYCAIFVRIDESKRRKKSAYRHMQIEHGLTREAHVPDSLKTVLVIQSCILVEGLLTAALMISDGKMNVVGALVYGLSVSAINVATGVIAGFFALRRVQWKIRSEYQTPRDAAVRVFARIAFTGFVAVMGTLHIAAARVRATGSHEDIFDFSEIGFFATFADYYAIAIVVAGAIGGILAVYEGYQGLSDPVPDYARARKDAEERFDRTAETSYRQAMDQLDRLHDEACAAVEAEEGGAEDDIASFRNDCISLRACL